jgi:hypothetical protein
MRARLLTLLCVWAVMLTASAQAQIGTSPPGASSPGTTGLSSNPPGSSTNTPGTNSLGTAQSSGRGGGGQGAASVADDPALKDEDRKVDRTVKSICRGC